LESHRAELKWNQAAASRNPAGTRQEPTGTGRNRQEPTGTGRNRQEPTGTGRNRQEPSVASLEDDVKDSS